MRKHQELVIKIVTKYASSIDVDELALVHLLPSTKAFA